MSDVATNDFTMPKPPPQIIDKLTGYPTWRTPYPGWSAEKLDAITFMSFTGVLFGMCLAVYYRTRYSSSTVTIADTTRSVSVLFTTLITLYLVATTITVGGFWAIDVGKLWVTTGTMHNAMELGMLLLMVCAKWREGFEWFYGAIFVYWAFTQAMCIALPWPNDGVYFKFQGLILDFALIINFARLIRHNRSGGHITLGHDETEDDSQSLVPKPQIDEAGRPIPVLPTDADQEDEDTHRSTSPTLPQNDSLYLLLWASIIHTLGNCVTTVSLSETPFLAFQFTYGISFPLYGYYVAKQPGGGSRIRWYDATLKKEMMVFAASTVLAGVVSAVGIKVTLDYYGW